MIFKKLFFKVFGKLYNKISPTSYMKCYVKYLKRLGIIINGNPNYISSDVYFDGHDYTKITLEDGCVISREVMLLTHDYSIARGIQALTGEKTWKSENTPHFLKEIYIGKNSFIGLSMCFFAQSFVFATIFAGFPTTMLSSGIFPFTTLPAPMIQFSPI